jgi:hypothetical protein
MVKPNRLLSDAEKATDNMIKNYYKLEVFQVISNGLKYIIFLTREHNDKYYQVHFSLFNKPDNSEDLNIHKSPPLGLFGNIFTIVYYRCIRKGLSVELIAPSTDRVIIYKKFIHKILKDNNINYSISIKDNEIYLDNILSEKYFNTSKFVESNNLYVVHNSDNSDLNTTTLSELQKVTPLRF